uniref:Uncharacterized protein n=1 Tax=Cacopsylla melanoneura TaxID=428564 RepID=A0A8D8XTV0_9HEMI
MMMYPQQAINRKEKENPSTLYFPNTLPLPIPLQPGLRGSFCFLKEIYTNENTVSLSYFYLFSFTRFYNPTQSLSRRFLRVFFTRLNSRISNHFPIPYLRCQSHGRFILDKNLFRIFSKIQYKSFWLLLLFPRISSFTAPFPPNMKIYLNPFISVQFLIYPFLTHPFLFSSQFD